MDNNIRFISSVSLRAIQELPMKIKLEDILIWIFIAIAIGTALWLLHGSPPEIDAVVAVGIAIGGSDLLIWKKIFSIGNKTALDFMKTRHEIDKLGINMNNQFKEINNKLNNIENKLKKK